MKTRTTSFMGGLLILGILGASDSIAAATIKQPISDASAAQINRILDLNDIEEISIDEIGIDNIAIRHIINPDILDDEIETGITKIAA